MNRTIIIYVHAAYCYIRLDKDNVHALNAASYIVFITHFIRPCERRRRRKKIDKIFFFVACVNELYRL